VSNTAPATGALRHAVLTGVTTAVTAIHGER